MAQEESAAAATQLTAQVRVYAPPRLTSYGPLRTVTTAGTGNASEGIGEPPNFSKHKHA
jgi:hypothetical protein